MSSHIRFPEIDPKWPASLSPTFLSKILREEFHFQGLIITDDTGGMAAITANYQAGPATVQAVLAGSDLVMVVGDGNRQAQAFDALVDAAEQGTISPERLDASVRRILEAKLRLGLLDPAPPAQTSGSAPGSPEHLDIVRRIADAAITIVRDDGSQLPAARTAKQALIISPADLPAVADGTALGQEVKARVPNATELVFRRSDGADNSAVLNRAVSLARTADLVVVGIVDAGPWQQDLLVRLQQAGAHPIVIGFGRPYDLAKLPRSVAYLAAYEPRADLAVAAVKVLFGERLATGRLPVPIGDLYPAGHPGQSTAPSATPTRRTP